VETVEEETAAEGLESGPLGGVEVGRSQVNQDEFTHGAETGAAVEPEGDAVVGSFVAGRGGRYAGLQFGRSAAAPALQPEG
jgi:hypothetical protein